MHRRRLLQIGIASAAVLAIAGGGLALLRPGLADGRLTDSGRRVFRAVARAVLDGSLPTDAIAQALALDAHLVRLSDAIAAFPAATQDELSQLLALLASAPGRVAFAGLAADWPDASVQQVQHALQVMRTSSLALRMQAYHALRDLTNAAYYADPSAWAAMGYPGPRTF
jgi:hypothetical protein